MNKKALALVPFVLGGVVFAPNPTQAAKPADFGLKEGDVISADGDPDVYIVNENGYKRLFVNPSIFNLYGHLGWNKIKKVTPAARDSFVTSGLFRNCESTDGKVYGLDVVNEDIANLRWVNTTGTQAVKDDPDFFKKVFCINTKEAKLYGAGSQYSSVLQIPKYNRSGSTSTSGLKIDLVAPNKILAGHATNVVVKGSGFKTGAKIDFGSGDIQPAYAVVSDIQINVLVPIGMPALSYNLSVTNPDGQVAILSNALTVQTAPNQTNGLSDVEIFSKVAPSTALIFTGNYTGAGTGIILSADGYILTNQHVVGNHTSVDVYLNDGGYFYQPFKHYTGTVLGKDSINDLAIIKITASGLKAIEVGSSSNSSLPVGSPVYALGFPLIFQVDASSVKFLSGKVVGTTGQYLQIDVPIQPGNSGGPLVNNKGQLVGINNLCLTTSQVFCTLQGQSFAITIDYANQLIPGLKSGAITTPTPSPNTTPTPTPSATPVSPGNITATKYTAYADQNISPPNTAIKIGHYALAAGSSEDINLNSVNIGINPNGTFTASKLSNVYIKIWSTSGSLIYTSPAKSTVSSSGDNSYSVNFTVPKGGTYQVEVFADVASGININDTIVTSLSAQGVGSNTATSLSTSTVAGQTITAKTGVLSYDNGSISAATLAAGGSTKDAYSFTLQPTYDDFTLDEIYIDLSSAAALSTGAVANLQLFEGSTILSSATINSSTSSASFTGLNRPLSQSVGTKTFTIKVQLANVGSGANGTYGTVVVRLDGLKYRSSSGAITNITGLNPSSYSGNDIRLVKAYPTFTNVTLDNSPLGTGEQIFFKTTVSGNGGDIGLYALKFDITTTNGPTLSADMATYKLYANGVNISSLGSFDSDSSVDLAVAGAHTGRVRFKFTSQYVVSSAVTFELRGQVTAIGSNYQAVSTKIANPKNTSSVPASAAIVAESSLTASSPSVVWTDLSAAEHSLVTADWFNDYLIQTINVSQIRAISQ